MSDTGCAVVNLKEVDDLGSVVEGFALVVVPVRGGIGQGRIAGLALAVDDVLVLAFVEGPDEVRERTQQGVSLSECLI